MELEDDFLTLAEARPTAANLFWALNRMRERLLRLRPEEDVLAALEAEAVAIHESDREAHERQDENGRVEPGTLCDLSGEIGTPRGFDQRKERRRASAALTDNSSEHPDPSGRHTKKQTPRTSIKIGLGLDDIPSFGWVLAQGLERARKRSGRSDQSRLRLGPDRHRRPLGAPCRHGPYSQ